MSGARILAADLTWVDGAFRPGLGVTIDAAGRIAQVAPLTKGSHGVERLPGRALLPGFVNAHSHAFQRGLRGEGESFPAGVGSFWSWREAMYGLVQTLSPDDLYQLSHQAFEEMLQAGITSVGEFHYLHHPGGDRWSGGEIVLQAAQDAGIRIALLMTHYCRGGFGEPLEAAQVSFDTRDADTFFQEVSRLSTRLASPRQTLGLVAHSLRAVPLEDLAQIHREARRRDWPFHLHLEEQTREVEACEAFLGRRPMECVLDLGDLTGTTAVHCTHTTVDDLERFFAAGGRVCVCPLTEANLGDGLPALGEAGAASGRLCLGSDSNARISMLEEIRWLEYGQRLRGRTRGAFADSNGDLGGPLIDLATRGGAAALGLETGRIATGLWADLITIDLEAPQLRFANDPHRLSTALWSGGTDQLVREVWVGGRLTQERSP